jgi:hypothetical protein
LGFDFLTQSRAVLTLPLTTKVYKLSKVVTNFRFKFYSVLIKKLQTDLEDFGITAPDEEIKTAIG